MELRRDSRGRSQGLAWPEAPEFTPEQVQVSARRGFSGTPNLGGRERQEYCGSGRHLMSEHGREIKSGTGRYCNACKTERQRESNRLYRERKKQARKPVQ